MQLPVVVDLAIERDSDRPVLVGDRWIAPLQVDDGQPSLSYPRPCRLEGAFGVWAPMPQRRQLLPDSRGSIADRVDLTGDSAHLGSVQLCGTPKRADRGVVRGPVIQRRSWLP